MIFNAEEKTHLKLYNKSIDIEITPENEVFSNFRLENLPDIVNIKYCDITDIIDFFNSLEGGVIIQKVFQNEVHLNIFAEDTTYITDYEKEFLIGHESLLKRKNVRFYQIWYDPDISFPYHLGTTIHEALIPFIEKYRDYNFDYTTKQNHFLTLNNVHTPSRELLFNFYNELSNEDKEKFICSFKFANVSLENEKKSNFDEIFQNFNEVFGNSIFPHYESSLIEIISESSDVAVTEKSFKPLLSGLPLIWWIEDFRPEHLHQIEIFKSIGIDTCYFGIDYTRRVTIREKINELLSLSTDEILEKYEDDFIKAKENKNKVFEYIDTITNDIIKK